jgi:hypothetical protein
MKNPSDVPCVIWKIFQIINALTAAIDAYVNTYRNSGIFQGPHYHILFPMRCPANNVAKMICTEVCDSTK